MLKSIKRTLSRLIGGKPNGDAALWQERFSRLQATYDAARTSDEFKNYWANADRLDADSANSKAVRHTLISRARYEAANNPFFDGIAQTLVNDLIGVGPTLRMQSGSEGFNRLVEFNWFLWSEAAGFNRKLWCMAHGKHVDGETFGVLRRNPRIAPIPLEICLYEAEQCQSPWLQPGDVDGIRFDQFGNPTIYEFLEYHPGATNRINLTTEAEQVPAAAVAHWFRMRRPGQHRGVPEMASSLNAGAAARRWREATLSAAERAALLTLMMKTEMQPGDHQMVAPFSTMDIEKGLMSFLPKGWEPFQAEGKFPTATHAEFNKSLINEMGRSVNMPRNKAACDSSDYNYASGRLDHGTYYDSLDVQRQDCGQIVLDKIFGVWFDMAVARFGWLGGDPVAISPAARLHVWDWPKHRVADVEAEASANRTKLESGQVFLPRLYSDAGWDFEDELQKAAEAYGVSVDEMRKRLLDVTLPAPQQPQEVTPNSVDDAVAAMFRRIERRNGTTNGHAHAN